MAVKQVNPIWPLQDIANCKYSIYLYGSYEAGRKVDRGGVIVFVGWGERELGVEGT